LDVCWRAAEISEVRIPIRFKVVIGCTAQVFQNKPTVSSGSRAAIKTNQSFGWLVSRELAL